MPHFGLVDGQMSASEKEQAVLVIMHPLGQDTTYFIIHCTLIVPGRERKALSSHKVAFATRYATKAESPNFVQKLLCFFMLASGAFCIQNVYRPPVHMDYRSTGSSKVIEHGN